MLDLFLHTISMIIGLVLLFLTFIAGYVVFALAVNKKMGFKLKLIVAIEYIKCWLKVASILIINEILRYGLNRDISIVLISLCSACAIAANILKKYQIE